MDNDTLLSPSWTELDEREHGGGQSNVIEDTLSWRIIHAFSFMLGGTTFIIGTCLLFSPSGATLSAAFYTLGSLGFLVVDIQEFCTFTSSFSLLLNIGCSMIGSAFYVAGSIAFFPQLGYTGTLYGEWGFVLGSIFIAVSQSVKVARLLISTPPPPSAWISIGVEASAFFGAFFFLLGTLYLQYASIALDTILYIWLAGSLAFTLGGSFLSYRHFVLKLS